jgi:hypothetical protein
MADPFITAQDVVDILGRGSTSDAGIAIAISAACDVVRTFTEQSITEATETIALDGSGTDVLLLPERPATSVTSVSVGGTAISDYALQEQRAVLYRGGTAADAQTTWPDGRMNVSVTYTHGYTSTTLPRDLKMVALQLAQRVVVQGVAISEQLGDVRVQYAAPALDLTPGERLILTKYRQIR